MKQCLKVFVCLLYHKETHFSLMEFLNVIKFVGLNLFWASDHTGQPTCFWVGDMDLVEVGLCNYIK